jgi:hypothetical protein
MIGASGLHRLSVKRAPHRTLPFYEYCIAYGAHTLGAFLADRADVLVPFLNCSLTGENHERER